LFYRNFAQWFSGDFVNITRCFPILFTWRSLSLPLFWAHIDHVFINKHIGISDLENISIPWSDHRGFSFFIQ
jgi:hypothetical protein